MLSSPLVPITAMALMLAIPCQAADEPQANPGMTRLAERIHFAEPGSGRKVRRYWIELPFKDDKARSFRIPCECPHILAELEFDEAARDTVMGRSIWQKVATDCRYIRYLTRHNTERIVDHVSSFDFENAPLDRFPLDPDCERGRESHVKNCNPFELDRRGMLRYFPVGQASRAGIEPGLEQTCRLRSGIFHGVLIITPGAVRCFDAERADGIRLTGIDFADVNGDGILDAVLRLSTLGPMSGRQRLRLPLTRSSTDADFETPMPVVNDDALP